MTVNQSGWRPEAPRQDGRARVREEGATVATFSGNKALMLEEPLIFEIGDTKTTGVDFAEGDVAHDRLGGLTRKAPIGLPGLSEPETVRHYTRLSRQNYAIDLGLFPLGSCTMKHNPRLNERMARLPGFADIHPLQPVDTVQGALGVINELAHWLIALTGMHAVAMSPKAGAHGRALRHSVHQGGAGGAGARATARSSSCRRAHTAPTPPPPPLPASRWRTSPPPPRAASTPKR